MKKRAYEIEERLVDSENVYKRQQKGVLKAKGLSTAVGDEGGFAPVLASNEARTCLLYTSVAADEYRGVYTVSIPTSLAQS